MRVTIDTTHTRALSPYIFGHNLEHTRAAVTGGLSAQMLRNRKFAGKPAKNLGLAAEWELVGDRAFCQMHFRPAYTRHISCEKMPRRNELSAQSIQNLWGGECGMAQRGLTVEAGAVYELRAVTACFRPIALRAALTSSDGQAVYAETTLNLTPGDWQTSEFTLTPSQSDDDAALRLTFTEKAELVFGAVSMMKAGHFHGMRADVVARLKEIGPAIIRWPGGNFAGEYRWKDGLLPADMRGPLQAVTEIETQPYSHGYDFHEISTDDFIALCREVGAEPFLTINVVWNSPEDSADWVEYCNGSTGTEYGKKRAENGHPEPYNVRFWSLGNEMGYGHMEGPQSPADYAAMVTPHARAMKAVSPDICLFSSGPYPNDDWAKDAAAALYPLSDYVSLHHYASGQLEYSTPEQVRATYCRVADSVYGARNLIHAMRESLDKFSRGIHISFDEWNFWYAWYRPSCVAEGIFAARMLHMLIAETPDMDAPVCCYFQPVGEGAILVEKKGARLTAIGQMFSLMKAHNGAAACAVSGDDDCSVAATVKGGVLTVTLINPEYDAPRDFTLTCPGEILESRMYTSTDVIPYTDFDESPLPVDASRGELNLTLPPHSVGLITLKLA